MKTASAALKNLLASATTLKVADLYTFSLTNGITLRYTNHDKNITYGGYTYYSILIERTKFTFEAGLSVDNLKLTINPRSTDVINNIAITQSIRGGTFDGCTLQLDMAFFTDWESTPEILEKLFFGNVDVDELSRSEIKLECKSATELLNIKLPKNLYQVNWNWVLYGAGCGLEKGDYTYNGSVTTGSTASVINCDLSEAEGFFTQGIITFITGQNLNIARTVKYYDTGEVTLINPLPFIPEEDDDFTITIGCAHNRSDCDGVFANEDNFCAFPYIPPPDSQVY